MKQQWLPPTPEEEALQQPDYTPWDFLRSLSSPQSIIKGGVGLVAKKVGKGIYDELPPHTAKLFYRIDKIKKALLENKITKEAADELELKARELFKKEIPDLVRKEAESSKNFLTERIEKNYLEYLEYISGRTLGDAEKRINLEAFRRLGKNKKGDEALSDFWLWMDEFKNPFNR